MIFRKPTALLNCSMKIEWKRYVARPCYENKVVIKKITKNMEKNKRYRVTSRVQLFSKALIKYIQRILLPAHPTTYHSRLSKRVATPGRSYPRARALVPGSFNIVSHVIMSGGVYGGGKSRLLGGEKIILRVTIVFSLISLPLLPDEVGAIIFDCGHQSLRVGYGGEDTPKAEIPTTLGVWEDENSLENSRKRYNIDVTAVQVRKKGEKRLEYTSFRGHTS